MSKTVDQNEQKQLKNLIERRHPQYEEMLPHWEFLSQTYEGGRGWFSSNIFKYEKEGDKEYKARLDRCYRFNHTREVVDLVDKYLFKMEVHRNEEDAPESVKTFWKNATLSGLSIQDFMKRVSNRGSVFGRIWIVVDRTRADAEVKTRADERKANVREYAYFVPPTSVLDMSYDDFGILNWILIYETGRDDEDPFASSGEPIHRFRLWTRTDSTVFIARKVRGKLQIEQQSPVVHDLGIVPVFAHDNVISDEPYTSPAMIADVAYLDRAVANYLSNMDAIIQDQTFSQLVIPAQAVLEGEEEKMVEIGTKRIFTYDGEGGIVPQFISPDVKQAQLILQAINKIINEIYHSVGLAGERTKEDNALGIDNSSGVAKAYDFERVNSLLAAKADSLEVTELKIIEFIAAWRGEGIADSEEKLVSYPDNFDVRGLYDEFEIAARLSLLEAPDSVRREQMDAVIEKLFPKISKEMKSKIEGELKTWPPKPVLPDVSAGSGGSDLLKNASNGETAKELTK